MNARKIAKQLYYTGKSNLTPTEDEERELVSKWGMEYPYGDSFNREVSTILGADPQQRKVEIANVYEDITDALEEHFGIDIDNVDPHKYSKLNAKLEAVRSFVLQKIENANIDEMGKNTLKNNIKAMKSVDAILMHLIYRSMMPY